MQRILAFIIALATFLFNWFGSTTVVLYVPNTSATELIAIEYQHASRSGDITPQQLVRAIAGAAWRTAARRAGTFA